VLESEINKNSLFRLTILSFDHVLIASSHVSEVSFAEVIIVEVVVD